MPPSSLAALVAIERLAVSLAVMYCLICCVRMIHNHRCGKSEFSIDCRRTSYICGTFVKTLLLPTIHSEPSPEDVAVPNPLATPCLFRTTDIHAVVSGTRVQGIFYFCLSFIYFPSSMERLGSERHRKDMQLTVRTREPEMLPHVWESTNRHSTNKARFCCREESAPTLGEELCDHTGRKQDRQHSPGSCCYSEQIRRSKNKPVCEYDPHNIVSVNGHSWLKSHSPGSAKARYNKHIELRWR